MGAAIMPNEIELTLSVPTNALHRVAKLPWLRQLVSGSPKREQLVSVYFDSKEHKLRDYGVTLRVRHAGRKYIQTIKAASGVHADVARSIVHGRKQDARRRPEETLTLAIGLLAGKE
jgi:inorganic triphosphatase YgiF